MMNLFLLLYSSSSVAVINDTSWCVANKSLHAGLRHCSAVARLVPNSLDLQEQFKHNDKIHVAIIT